MSDNAPSVLTLLFSDIAGSTSLAGRIGEQAFAAIQERMAFVFDECCKATEGQFIDQAGDGYYASFTIPSQAVECGLLFLWRVEREVWPHGEPVQIRVGAHCGVIRHKVFDPSSGKLKPSGVAVVVAQRIMAIDAVGRLFVTDETAALAREQARRPNHVPPLGVNEIGDWYSVDHGLYGWKGGPEALAVEASASSALTSALTSLSPLRICEIVMRGREPLRPSPSSAGCFPVNKDWTRRAEREDPIPVLRAGEKVPGNTGGAWVLERLLGRGGFGEVWLAHDQNRDGEYRAFKFPNDPQRFRSFLREDKLYRILARELELVQGDTGIVKVLGLTDRDKLGVEPMWIATEYIPDGSLLDWIQSHPDQFSAMSEAAKVQFIMELARIVQNAHDVGVIHKDIKPSNIFIRPDSDGVIHPLLGDFGIGCVARQELIDKYGIGNIGLASLNSLLGDTKSRTPFYSPPEYDKPGAEPTYRGDVYALGVVLYQFIIADFNEPRSSDDECRRRIKDKFLAAVIISATDGESNRIDSAINFAVRLGRLAEDRLEEAQRELAQAKQLARRRRVALMIAFVGMMIACGGWWYGYITAQYAKAQRLAAEKVVEAAISDYSYSDKQDIAMLKNLEHTARVACSYYSQFESSTWTTDFSEKLLDFSKAYIVYLNVSQRFDEMPPFFNVVSSLYKNLPPDPQSRLWWLEYEIGIRMGLSDSNGNNAKLESCLTESLSIVTTPNQFSKHERIAEIADRLGDFYHNSNKRSLSIKNWRLAIQYYDSASSIGSKSYGDYTKIIQRKISEAEVEE